ncbi:lipid-A-disaccharide synthase [Acuticoccus sediminis]|uniref:Lipid-A-disaccharide synthase n=1 Tax=Acuticoccus sediminis TaxID=2184697 RepID=A0A8B2NTY8_9HYPH|nr:lipid-A-disaccharide synthase [Acuticoccus sediminis]RAH99809.1 lipid-A-disaccharide synthase [Acuticoccus sediminis]
MSGDRPLRIAIIAGEQSGDRLGGALMQALNERRSIEWCGIGAEDMTAAGLEPIFPQDEISVMGIDAIIRQLPRLLRRIREAADAVIAFRPDVLVVIDAPEFNHRVAKRVRRARPEIPIVNYVSPTVWAWRPGRARAMVPYTDLVMALFPFEPAVHERLGGPRCVYVGHPLYERMRSAIGGGDTLLVLPGSRRLEIERLMPSFGEALGKLAPSEPVEVLAVPHLRARIEELASTWPVPVTFRDGSEKLAVFARAKAALAASGTVTMELAAARIPMVVAYKLDIAGRFVKKINRFVRIVTAPSMVLANIVVGRNDIPALLEEEVTADGIAARLAPLLTPGSPERAVQERVFDEFAEAMRVDTSPAETAADAVLSMVPPDIGTRAASAPS